MIDLTDDEIRVLANAAMALIQLDPADDDFDLDTLQAARDKLIAEEFKRGEARDYSNTAKARREALNTKKARTSKRTK